MAGQDPTSPESAFQDADQIITPKRDWMTRLGTALNSGQKGTAMEQALNNRNQRQIDEAKMHHQNASTAGGALFYDTQMQQTAQQAAQAAQQAGQTDPDAIKLAVAKATNNYRFLTPEERQTYQTQHDAAMDAYEKIVGVDKNTKTALGRARGIVDHLIKHGHPLGAAGVGAPSSPSGLPQPPAPPSVTPQSLGASQVDNLPLTKEAALTPPPAPPSAAPAPAQSAAADKADDQKEFQMRAPFLRQQLAQKLEDAHAINMYKSKKDIDEAAIIAEQAAKAKAMAANPKTMRYSPKIMGPQLPEGAVDINGQPITADKGGPETVWTTFDGGNHFMEVSGDYFTKTVGNRLQLYNKRTGTLVRDISDEVGSPVNLGSTSSHTAPGITLDGRIAPVTTTTSRKPVTAGAPINGVSPGANPNQIAAPPTPGAVSPTSVTTPGATRPRAAQPGVKDQSNIAIPFAAMNQINQRIVPVREATTQILGTWDNPDAPSMKDYGVIANNPSESKALGNALRLSLEHLTSKEKASGGFTEMLSNYGGLTQNIIDSERQVMEDVIGKLSPRNQRAYNATMAGYGMMAGLRSLNKSSAAKFAMANLEREYPLIGLNSFNKASFDDKLSHIATEIYNGYRTLPVPQGEKDYVKQFIKGGQMDNKIDKPPAPGTGQLSDSAKKYLDSKGINY